VDVTSRPSSCLINFLLSGRSVLLEMPRKSGGKITSHLLSAHGGEIFIHSLNTSRSVLEECPSISEGVGGKIVNYRIPDFVQVLVQQRLVPLKTKYPDENLGKVRARIAKMTKYWPITFNSTVVYNIRQYVEPILVLTQKEDLTEEEVLACQQCIYQLVGIEARHDLVLNNQRMKGNKKEDQYRLMWNELEVIVGLNGKSVGHKAILQCIRKVRSAQTPESSEKEVDSALGGLRKMLDVSEPATSMTSILRSSVDSPLSPTPLKGLKHRATMTLYDIVMAKEQAIANKRMDFSGRLSTPDGQVAVLYPHLVAKEIQAEMKS
jgi:Cell cycle and development regulator